MRDVGAVLAARGGALVLREARLDLSGARDQAWRVEAGEVVTRALELHPEHEPVLLLFEHARTVTGFHGLVAERGMAGGERETMERRHHDQRVPGGVAYAPFGPEAFARDALLPCVDRVLDLAFGQRERHGVRRHRRAEQQERRDGAGSPHGAFPTTTRLNSSGGKNFAAT